MKISEEAKALYNDMLNNGLGYSEEEEEAAEIAEDRISGIEDFPASSTTVFMMQTT